MKNLSAEVVTGTLAFLAMFVFFSQVHPIVLFDGDDWNVISDARVGLPKWHGWNPIKILPETFFPICGYFAAYVVRPIIGDYLTAFTLTAALIVSFFIAAYVSMFIRFIKAIFNFDKLAASIFGAIFLLLHFAVFLQHNTQDNLYLFHTTDADCYFNYVLPNLLNAALVLFVARVDLTRKFFDRPTPATVTLFFVLYLAIFSNVLSSCVLAIYVFVELMSRVKPKEFNLKKFFAANRMLCVFLIFWLISLLFEANGGRARAMAHEESYIELVFYTAATLIQSLLLDNRGFALMIFSLVTLPFMWREKKDLWLVAKKFLLCLPLWTVYIILVAARAEATYALRPDVQFGFFFFLFVIFFTALGFWIKKFPRAALILPILCFALFTWIFSGKRTLCPSTFNHVPESVCVQVSQHLIDQIIAADRAGLEEVTITVPKGDDVDNYPFPLYMGKNISRTLHAHGMISRRLEVEILPDATLNERFNLP
ncbi:MAG: hypothetical protein IJP42_03575 [Selenomonadaceae bacterium]|nr:hypothetical protein [Selenomonadaceae bacterium]